jgi:hypothetical protein
MPRFLCHSTVLLALIFLVSCGADDAGESISWEEVGLTGKTLELIDEQRVEAYQFQENNLVMATFGEKNGALTAPILYWKLDNKTLLISQNDTFQDSEKFRAPLMKNGVLTIRTSFIGKSKFRLLK